MSNELRSVHDIPPDEGMISMGTCAGCNQPWFMTASEHAGWEKLIKEKNLHWPKRCKDCRSNKRKQEQSRPPGLFDISERLKFMAEKAVNEEYEGDSDRLAQDLTDIVTQLDPFVKQERRL